MSEAKKLPAAPAAPAAPTSTKPSPQPAAKVKKAKEKKIRVWHPALKPDAEGKPTVMLTAVPADYDRKIHRPFKRSHFENEAPLLEFAADQLEKKAKALREEANEVRTMGSNSSRQMAKQMKKYRDKLAEMAAKLKEQGIDPDEFLKSLQ